MKTRRILALVLVLALALTGSAGAAYVDQGEVRHPQAVELLTALSVVGGTGEGFFRPAQPVTRAEMVKMIYVLSNGEDDKAALYNSFSHSFEDVGLTTEEYWAANYIKWAVYKGVVSGYSASVFAPNDTVTGVQAAKMLLVSLGYDAQKEGYSGDGWTANVAADAAAAGLLKDLSLTRLSQNLDRDEAAQMISNALLANRVEYGVDGARREVDADRMPTLLEKSFGLKRAVGILTAAGERSLGGLAREGTVRAALPGEDGAYAAESQDGRAFLREVTYKGGADSGLVGFEVELFYRDREGSTPELLCALDAGTTSRTYQLPANVDRTGGANLEFLDGAPADSLEGSAGAVYLLRKVGKTTCLDFILRETRAFGRAVIAPGEGENGTPCRVLTLSPLEGTGLTGPLYWDEAAADPGASRLQLSQVAGGGSVRDGDLLAVTRQALLEGGYRYTVAEPERVHGICDTINEAAGLVVMGNRGYPIGRGVLGCALPQDLQQIVKRPGTFYLCYGQVVYFVAD